MDELNLWCKLIATVSVISSVLSLLIHESGIKKAFNTLMSIILVFVFIQPLSSGRAIVSSFADRVTDIELKSRETELESYFESALIDTAREETEKYIENIIGESKCEVVCDYDGEAVLIISISIEGDLSGKEEQYYGEIKRICDENTVIEFNGERYE